MEIDEENVRKRKAENKVKRDPNSERKKLLIQRIVAEPELCKLIETDGLDQYIDTIKTMGDDEIQVLEAKIQGAMKQRFGENISLGLLYAINENIPNLSKNEKKLLNENVSKDEALKQSFQSLVVDRLSVLPGSFQLALLYAVEVINAKKNISISPIVPKPFDLDKHQDDGSDSE